MRHPLYWILHWNLCLGFIAGCTDAQAEPLVEFALSELPASAGTDSAGNWQSVGWAGEDWLTYPSQGTMVVEHDLGRVPRSVLVYLSFESDGSGASLASGDLCRVLSVDENRVELRNGTRENFHFRLVLR